MPPDFISLYYIAYHIIIQNHIRPINHVKCSCECKHSTYILIWFACLWIVTYYPILSYGATASHLILYNRAGWLLLDLYTLYTISLKSSMMYILQIQILVQAQICTWSSYTQKRQGSYPAVVCLVLFSLFPCKIYHSVHIDEQYCRRHKIFEHRLHPRLHL